MKLLYVLLILLVGTIGRAQSYLEASKLVASDATSNDRLSNALSVDEEFVVVGAEKEQNNAGAVYLYKQDAGGTNAWGQVKKLVANDRENGALFGHSVAISGNYIFVGAPSDDDTGFGSSNQSNVGAVYVFRLNTFSGNWSFSQKLLASDFRANDRFGTSVALDGDYAIIGAASDDKSSSVTNSGSAYVFKRNGSNWTQLKKIVASDEAKDALFGGSIALDNGVAIVGAINKGAYLFEQNRGGTDNWGQVRKLISNDFVATDEFAVSVDISGGYAVVGAHHESEDENGGNSLTWAGAVYVFEQAQSWAQVQKVVADDRHIGSTFFGYSVAIAGNRMTVGAFETQTDGSGGNQVLDAGGAYVFERATSNTWIQTQKLVASDRAAGDRLGETVAMDTEHIVVGALREDHTIANGSTAFSAGAAYVYRQLSVALDVKAYLGGAYEPSTNDMRHDLESILPLEEPYTALGFANLQNTAVTAKRITLESRDVVDWVLLEVRSDAQTILAQRAALLLKDGRVVDVDGSSSVRFSNLTEGMYYVALHHRNHLAVMTASAIRLEE